MSARPYRLNVPGRPIRTFARLGNARLEAGAALAEEPDRPLVLAGENGAVRLVATSLEDRPGKSNLLLVHALIEPLIDRPECHAFAVEVLEPAFTRSARDHLGRVRGRPTKVAWSYQAPLPLEGATA